MTSLPSLPRRLSSRSFLGTAQPTPPSATTFDPTALFRQAERVVATQSCRVRTGYMPFVRAEALLVCSKTETGDEAAIFVMTPPTSSESASLLYIIPVVAGFKHRLEQTPPSPSTSFFAQSAKPHITLYVSYAATNLELRISATQSAKVQKLVAELRRLNDAACSSPSPRSLTHSWIQLYPVQTPQDDIDEVDDLGSPETTTPSNISASDSTVTLTADTPTTAITLVSATSGLDEEECPDPYLPSFSRTDFMRKRLFTRQEKWSTKTDIRIRVATYNVNDKIPPKGTLELAPLVGDGEEDLLVFGFQEADLRGQALLISQGNDRAESWETALLNGLGPRADEFEKLVRTQYVGVMMIIFVRKSLKERISRVQTSERGIGLLGFGGVAVRLRVHDTTLCFVNAHMAAFATALERRRNDYLTLKTGLSFPRPSEEDLVVAFEEFWPENKDRLLGQEDAHALFWMGDLNYRVDLPDNHVRKLVEDKKWDELLEKDQLKTDIASEKSFAGFFEHPISFPPSFKYVHGSKTLDTRRAPAYTDRILWSLPPITTSPPPTISCQQYTSHEILWSDHRPVSAVYTLEARVVDEGNQSIELAGIRKELDKLEEIYRPSLEIEGTSLDFGDVRYRQSVARSIKLRNTGRVPAVYSFKSPSADKPICKPFIWPFPASAVVEPGQDLDLRVIVNVDEIWSAKLTLGEDVNDVLVLQIAGGKDTFITVQATYLPSVVSLPLHVLSTLPSPIRQLPLSERKVLARPLAPSGTNGEAPIRPVRDIWRLLECLMSTGIGVEGLWTEDVEVGDVIECIDTGKDLPAGREKQVASSLLHLLAAMPAPLLPTSHHADCLKAEDRDAAFAVLEGVPQIHTNVLIGLMSVVKLCASGKVEDSKPEEGKTVEKSLPSADDVSGTVTEPGPVIAEHDDAKPGDTQVSDPVDTVVETEDQPKKSIDEQLSKKLDEISFGDDKTTGGSPAVGSLGEAIELRKKDSQGEIAFSSPRRKSSTTPSVHSSASEAITRPKSDSKTTTGQPVEQNYDLVDKLCPAVFGRVTVDHTRHQRRRFIRLLLEG
ncbi:hypothetical protein IAR55_006009 [Kwoniella newhampshirensis]|uniref:Inositol polyphosphate-related phosphatase domain-containing protein n=1 Tax=Kwoniella newhampshirensis TaxID=1651941 RepID=A0AAW0YUB7_9TREE